MEAIRIRFGLGQSQAYRRMQVLRQVGVVRSQRLLVNRPTLYLPAGRALRPASFEHVFLASNLVACRERHGSRMITEKELRRERSGEPAFPRWIGAEQRQVALRCRRTPDAVELLPSGGMRAFEIELSSKGRSRREAILGNYAASNYEQVNWIAPNPRLAALLRREIEGLGLSRFMEVTDE